MKKIVVILVIFCGFNFSLKSQNSFSVKIGEELCLNQISVCFDDGSTEEFNLGCFGEYFFNTNEKSVIVVFINGISCDLDLETPVEVDDDKPAVAKLARFSQYGKHLSVF